MIGTELASLLGLSSRYGMKVEASTEQSHRGIRIIVAASKDGEQAFSVASVDEIDLLAQVGKGAMINRLCLTLESCAGAATTEVKRRLHKRGKARCFCVDCMGRRLRERGRWNA